MLGLPCAGVLSPPAGHTLKGLGSLVAEGSPLREPRANWRTLGRFPFPAVMEKARRSTARPLSKGKSHCGLGFEDFKKGP